MATKKKKPVLKTKKESALIVDHNDLEKFILQCTGHEYECLSGEEWGNDSQHRFTVESKMNEYDIEEWETFKLNGSTECFKLGYILDGLCKDGFLKAGNYLITVSW
jgi:hypothetical protein